MIVRLAINSQAIRQDLLALCHWSDLAGVPCFAPEVKWSTIEFVAAREGGKFMYRFA
jgi:hypothetical protein